MQENIKEFKKRLRAMGFKRKNDRVYWYDNNGLFYVVSFKMEGGKVGQVGYEVSHAAMFEDGRPQQRASPVGGWLGETGVEFDSTALMEENPCADFLECAARGFFSYFKTASDWQTAIRGLHERGWPRFTEIPIHPDAGSLPVPWFVNDFAGELEPCQEFRKEILALFATHAPDAGFRPDDNDLCLFVRQRGELSDFMYIRTDDLGTFFRVQAHIWCSRFRWPAFIILGNAWLPAAGWSRSSDFLRDTRLARALLDEASAFFIQFATPQDWVGYLEKLPDWQMDNEKKDRLLKTREWLNRRSG